MEKLTPSEERGPRRAGVEGVIKANHADPVFWPDTPENNAEKARLIEGVRAGNELPMPEILARDKEVQEAYLARLSEITGHSVGAAELSPEQEQETKDAAASLDRYLEHAEGRRAYLNKEEGGIALVTTAAAGINTAAAVLWPSIWVFAAPMWAIAGFQAVKYFKGSSERKAFEAKLRGALGNIS